MSTAILGVAWAVVATTVAGAAGFGILSPGFAEGAYGDALRRGALADAARMAPDDGYGDPALQRLTVERAEADLAIDAAVAAVGRGDWDRIEPLLGPVARAFPADADALDLLESARRRRIRAAESALREATIAGDSLAAERALAALAIDMPADSAVAASLGEVRSSRSPVALARDKALWLVGPDGRYDRLLTDAVSVSRPVWSPDRSHLAFVSVDPSDGRAAGTLYVVDADGGEPRKRYGVAHPNAVPSWSPDGRYIALTSVARWDLRRETGILSVRVIDLSDGTSVDVSSGTGLHGTSPAWSPDGRHVAFIARPVLADPRESPLSGPASVWLWSVAEATVRPFPGLDAPTANRLIWSPDASTVLVLARSRGLPRENDGNEATILAADPESGRVVEVATGITVVTSSWSPAWSPDGNWLAWIDAPGDVVLLGRNGAIRRIDSRRFLSGSITWSPGSRSLNTPAADPDQPAARIDGIGSTSPTITDVDLPYDTDWPTGTPQWSPVLPAPDPAPATIEGTGLDRAGYHRRQPRQPGQPSVRGVRGVRARRRMARCQRTAPLPGVRPGSAHDDPLPARRPSRRRITETSRVPGLAGPPS